MNKTTNQQKGNAFERYIASIYEALHFQVTFNKSIAGQQVDVFAEKLIPGIGNTRLIIECKYLETGSVPNQQIYDFNNFMSSIRNADQSVKGILISNREFSKDAKSAAEAFQITLMTVAQLETEVLDAKEAFLKLKQSFEKQDIYQEFVPLYGRIDKLNNKVIEKTDLIEKLTGLEYYDWSKITFISILADYGSGKTTLLQRLNYLYSKKFLEGGKLKPIYLELKNFELYKDLNTFLVNSFIKLFQREIPIQTIQERINNGDFIFLLDGFDEMSPQVNVNVRLENLLKLSPLLLSNSNSIMTCRPSYFISQKEFNDAVDTVIRNNMPEKLEHKHSENLELIQRNSKNEKIYQKLILKYTDSIPIKKESSKIGSFPVTIKIHEFENDQIDIFLEKFDTQFESVCKSSWMEVKTFLQEIYDISDLLKKPILLSMIKDTILELGETYRQKNEVFDPVTLYETYTKANLHRDWSKGTTRQLLTNQQREKFAESIALLMFETDTLMISYKSLIGFIEKNSALLPETDFLSRLTIEEIASDIQVCAFIQRTDDEQFKFIHKSFMEFFVARQLKRQILDKKKTILSEKPVQKEILFFIGCYCYSDITLKEKFLKAISSKSMMNEFYKRNIFLALIFAKNIQTNLYAKVISIEGVGLDNLKFDKCELEEITFKACYLTNVSFINQSRLSGAVADAYFEKIQVIDSRFSLKVRDSKFNRIDILRSREFYMFDGITQIEYIRASHSVVKYRTRLDVINIHGFYNNSRIYVFAAGFVLYNMSLRKSLFSFQDCRHITIAHATINDIEINNSIGGRDLSIENSTVKGIELQLTEKCNVTIKENVFIDTHFKDLKIYPVDNVIEKNRFINCSGRIFAMNFNATSDFSFINDNNEKIKMVYNEKEHIKIGELEIVTIVSFGQTHNL